MALERERPLQEEDLVQVENMDLHHFTLQAV
jgi:hypothetical protein